MIINYRSWLGTRMSKSFDELQFEKPMSPPELFDFLAALGGAYNLFKHKNVLYVVRNKKMLSSDEVIHNSDEIDILSPIAGG